MMQSTEAWPANHLTPPHLARPVAWSRFAKPKMSSVLKRRVYRLYDFTRAQRITPGQYYCVSGKVNSADKLYLVMESVKVDTKHPRPSAVPTSAYGAEGGPMN
jgi:hypothetical protein